LSKPESDRSIRAVQLGSRLPADRVIGRAFGAQVVNDDLANGRGGTATAAA
jgi:hypothetical protein